MSILHNKLPLQTPNLTAQNIDKIAALFPNCITEMLDEEKSTPDHKVYKRGINFELLKQMLSPDVVDGDEAYEFTWVGKKASIVEANKPIRKTLRPCPEESKNWDDTENLYIEVTDHRYSVRDISIAQINRPFSLVKLDIHCIISCSYQIFLDLFICSLDR